MYKIENNNEIWKHILGFNYEISNKGVVRSLKTNKEKKLQIDKDGYYVVTLWKNGKCYYKRVNRLVAEAFISNPENLSIVNHKDEDKKNNNVTNLEWCTVKYNNNYSKSKAVIQLDLNGNFIQEFNSIKEAEEVTGFYCSHIQDCCSNKKNYCKTYKGFQWVYKSQYNPQKDYKINIKAPNRNKKIAQYDLDGNLLKIYSNLNNVNKNSVYRNGVWKCCNNRQKTAYGYKWCYI